MFKMTCMLSDSFKQKAVFRIDGEVLVFTKETESSSAVWVPFRSPNVGAYRIYFISCDDSNRVDVCVPQLTSVAPSRAADMLPVLNQLNNTYRFLKFEMDEDGEINVLYNYFEDFSNPGAGAMEVISRILCILDDAYPQLILAIRN